MADFETITPQPDFPAIDLTENNATHVGFYLQFEKGEQGYALYLRSSLAMIHQTGSRALEAVGITLDNTPDEYIAFCNGFAALEYTSQLVSAKQYDGHLAIHRVNNLFIRYPEIAEYEIADKYTQWLKSHPYTQEAILEPGIQQSESFTQLQARSMGAQIATLLQTA